MADKLKLIFAVLIVAIGIGAFYYLGDKPDLVRVLTLLAAGAVAVAVALQTTQGKAAWEFAKGARLELRRVVWPTNKETMQVTLVVFVLVVLVSLFLWAVDWGLLKLVQTLTGQGA
jgi:preprotein translocase subunit SecE